MRLNIPILAVYQVFTFKYLIHDRFIIMTDFKQKATSLSQNHLFFDAILTINLN